MSLQPPRLVLPGALLLLLGAVASAQSGHGGMPPSKRAILRGAPPTKSMRPVHNNQLLAEDEAKKTKEGLRFAEVLEVNLSLENSGLWEELPGGDRLWRLRVESPGAYSLALVFSRYQLCEGGELFIYDDQGTNVRGAYTVHENRLDGTFAVSPTRGDALTLEYHEPKGTHSELVLSAVLHDYRDVFRLFEGDSPAPTDRAGGNDADFCEVDVICPTAAGWQSQKDSTVHIISPTLGFLCSGVVLNNTGNDGTVLVLTAAHCGELRNGLFTFKFERTRCGRGTGLCDNLVTGATQLLFDEELDVQLVRLDPPANHTYPIHAAGWDRSDTVPASTITIHHPGGAEKKLSKDDDAPVKTNDGLWRVKDWEMGVTEGGSSGGPMIDPAGRVIGILDSGSSTCDVPTDDDFYTRLASVWTLLGPFLDPAATGQLTTDGLDITAPAPKPFDAFAVVPAEIQPLQPGVHRLVRVLGAGFTDATELAIDGAPVSASRFARATSFSINIDLPQLGIGDHILNLRENGQIKNVPFRILEASEPILQVAAGEGKDVEGKDKDLIFSQEGVDLLYADKVGHQHYCYWSFSGVPSISPRLTLQLGNQFQFLFGCLIDTMPAQGWMRRHHNISNLNLPDGATVYTQTICVWPRGAHGIPLHTSGLQTSTYRF